MGRTKEKQKVPTARVLCLRTGRRLLSVPVAISALLIAAPLFAAEIAGQVLGGGAPIAKSTVTLWSAGTDTPKQLGQAQTGDDGRFTLSFQAPNPEGISYL